MVIFSAMQQKTRWSIKFVPGAMGQNRFGFILSHCSRDKNGSMEQIFIMFHRGPSSGTILWNKKPALLQAHQKFF